MHANITIKENHIIGLYNSDATDVFTAYAYAQPNVTNLEIEIGFKTDITNLGGRVKKILVLKQWKDYFPFITKLEQLNLN